jgi:hypothetical protein
VEAADDERTLRRARKVVWAFRLIFYPGAAIAAFLLLTAGGGGTAVQTGPSIDELTELRGRTAQRSEFILRTHEGRPRHFKTAITAACPDGSKYTLDWYRVDADRIDFDEDTGAIDAELAMQGKWSDGVPMDYDAHLNGRLDGDAVTGTLRLVDQRDGYVCDSGPVSFSASR